MWLGVAWDVVKSYWTDLRIWWIRRRGYINFPHPLDDPEYRARYLADKAAMIAAWRRGEYKVVPLIGDRPRRSGSLAPRAGPSNHSR